MPRNALVVTALALTVSSTSCATSTTKAEGLPPLPTEEKVDLDRYLGTWFEIASIPQRFQRGCTKTTATYTPRDDGKIDVLNRCVLPDGTVKTADGRARLADDLSGAKLEVSFFGPFWADYWIIDVDPAYQYAVVGHPSRDYLWILSRTPTMDATEYQAILARLETVGYDTSRLVATIH